MYYLIYVSYAAKSMSDKELTELLDQSFKNNQANEITGMLLCLGGRFIQVLEGNKEQVIDLFDKIAVDTRHKKVSILLEGNTRKRTFVDWTMGFETENNEHMPTAFRDPKSYFGSTSLINQKHPTISFLKLFYEKNAHHDDAAAQAS